MPFSRLHGPVRARRARNNRTADRVGACSQSAACTAGGFYQDTEGNGGAVVATESAGTWSAATLLAMPGPALASYVLGVGCTSPGNCTAVGGYDNSSNNPLQLAFLATQSGGSWGKAALVAPPANHSVNPEAALAGVTCPVAGRCVAVGGYRTAGYHRRPMIATESGGSWHQPAEISLPANRARRTKSGGNFDSVSCAAVGTCIAVGGYDSRSGRTQPMAAFESHGHWAGAQQIKLPAGVASGALDAISCRATGLCVAVGDERTAGGTQQAIAVTERHGRWSRVVQIGKSGTGSTRPMVDAGTVSCGTASCVAIGDGYHAQPLAVSYAGGKWSRYAVILPSASAGSAADLGILQVACTGNSACTAVGFVQPKRKAQQLAVASRR